MFTRSTARGFTLIECMVVCAVSALLLTLAVPSFKAHDRRAGRLDAVQALTQLQMAQEQHRSRHGLYAGDLPPLRGVGARSTQGRYAISLAVIGPNAYTATAHALGPQAGDADCNTLTLSVKEGFAQQGPHAGCWLR
jgi:type IV pilus assembly protein PilE